MRNHKVEMTPQEQQKAIDIARQLSREFDRVGPGCDERNEFCHELVPLYKESGLVGIAVPKEYGGGGADIWTLSQISRELAKGDPACALAFNMHQTMVGIFRGLIDDDAKAKWFPQIADENKLVCGPFSEERAGLMGLADTTAAPTADGGWTVNGGKTWATLCMAADIIAFNATVVDEAGILPADHVAHAMAESVFIYDMATPGISIKETWDTMGMRATGTHTVLFDDAHGPGDAMAGNFRGGLFEEFEWAAMTFSGCYLGLTEKAYEVTKASLRKKTLGATAEGSDVALKGIGYVQSGLGRMKLLTETSERVLDATCQAFFDGKDRDMATYERVSWMDVSKIVTTENAIEVTDQGMRLIGGSTFRRGHALERLFRDSKSGPFHPLTTEQEYDMLGRIELGLMDPPAEAAPAADSSTNGAAATVAA
jgi:alkylation response protein AidB-like acyl-CoA dehydrogenase